jgi:protein gp37
MGDKTGIIWCESSWNPIVGCSLVSPGCTACYAQSMAYRIERMNPTSHYVGLTQMTKVGPVWNGTVRESPHHILTLPTRWARPRRIFVNSMSDLFHEDLENQVIDKVFAIMMIAQHHTYQILTKRSDRMRVYMNDPGTAVRVRMMVEHQVVMGSIPMPADMSWPPKHVWLGVSAEDQKRWDERVPDLLQTRAHVRWVSAEPLIGPIDPRRITMKDVHSPHLSYGYYPLIGAVAPWLSGQTVESCTDPSNPKIDWIVTGGESGAKARPADPSWYRTIRDACAEAGVAFLHKQNGEYFEGRRLGKHKAGRSLDGRTHDEYPEVRV